MIRTRIRELRKLRGLTLKELAEKVGTTPQTIQRLETASMTVSTAWLAKIAPALNVEPAELISAPGARDIPLLGWVGPNGAVNRAGYETGTFSLDIPAEDPVAVRLDHAAGRFEEGSILIASKLREADYASANGAECLIGLPTSAVLLRRVFCVQSGALLLAPLDAGAGAEFEQPIAWLAKVVMAVRYF